MAALDRRLDLLSSELTARERGILVLRAWCAGEQPDDRLTRYCPPHDKPSMDRIIDAFERGTGEGHGGLVILLEWMANTESALHSLRVLQVYRAHVRSLAALVKREVLAMPKPWRDQRKVPIGWGVLLENDDPDPSDWDEYWQLEVTAIQRSIGLRWQDVRSFDLVYEELATALGEPLIHAQVRTRLDWLRESVVRLHGEMEAMGEKFELPEPDDVQLETKRAHFDWEALRETSTEKHAREWLAGQKLDETLTWEREQAERVRNRS